MRSYLPHFFFGNGIEAAIVVYVSVASWMGVWAFNWLFVRSIVAQNCKVCCLCSSAACPAAAQ